MIPRFDSDSLGTRVCLNELDQFPAETLASLRDDVIKAVKDIDVQINETIALESRYGLTPDNDWLHRAKMKRRICLQFAIKIDKLLKGSEYISYQEAYAKHFEDILAEEIGPTSLERIKKEAKELALNDVGPD